MFCLNCDCVLIISLYQIRFYVRSTKFSSVIQSNLVRKRPPKIQQIDLVVAHREVVVFKNRTTRVGGGEGGSSEKRSSHIYFMEGYFYPPRR